MAITSTPLSSLWSSGGCISSWHLSPFIVRAGASLALLKIHTHTHTHRGIDIHTSCKREEPVWCGGGENAALLPTLLPGTNLLRMKQKRLDFISKINIKVVMWRITAKERLVRVVGNFKKLWVCLQLLMSVSVLIQNKRCVTLFFSHRFSSDLFSCWRSLK